MRAFGDGAVSANAWSTTDPVCSAVVHPSGSVVATSSGRDRVHDLQQDNSSDSESSVELQNEDDGGSASSASTSSMYGSRGSSLKLWSLQEEVVPELS